MPTSSHLKHSLITVPQELHYRLLNSLPDFQDLASVVLTARPLHSAFETNRRKVLASVGRNFLGSLFVDALLLARCQDKRDGSEARKIKGLSAGTVRLLVNNADTVGELQTIMFGLLQGEDVVDVSHKPSLTRFAEAPPIAIPSETESLRFKCAAYRFCVYCLLQSSEGRLAFLSRYLPLQVLELAHFVNALYTLVHVIRGRPHETDDDWDFVSRVMSAGPHTVLDLWEMKCTRHPEFKAALKDAGVGSEGHFMNEWCDLLDAELTRLGISEPSHGRGAIIDEENRKLGEKLGEAAAAKAIALEQVKRAEGGRKARVAVEYGGADPFD